MFCGAVLAEPILGWAQNFMLDDKIVNSIINQFSKILLMLERREIGL